MRCSEFLSSYTDFRDHAEADPVLYRRAMRHLASCRRCARHHEAIVRGVTLLRSLRLDPTPGFRSGLRRRLARIRWRAEPLYAVPLRLAGSLLLAVAVIAILLEGFSRWQGRSEPVLQAARPMPMVQTNPAPPFVTFSDLSEPVLVPATGYIPDPSSGPLVRVASRDR